MKISRLRKSRQRAYSAAVVGCGNIGSFACWLLARFPWLKRLVLVDMDPAYTPANVAGQAIFARDAYSGLPKVEVMKRLLAQVRSDLEIITHCCPVAVVPRGYLRVDVILVCLDSKRGRMEVNEIAWRLGVPFLDGGVLGDRGLARVTTFTPGPTQNCLECSWADADYANLEQQLPCGGGWLEAATPATNAPACLGSLCASWQTLLASQLLAGHPGQPAPGHQHVLDALSHRFTDSTYRRNDCCRFDHQVWRIQTLRRSPSELTLGQALQLGRANRRAQPGALTFEPGFFVRTMACQCGARREALRLSARVGQRPLKCRQCGEPMVPINLGAASRLVAPELAPRELSLPLSRLGFRPGDIFGVGTGSDQSHYQFALK